MLSRRASEAFYEPNLDSARTLHLKGKTPSQKGQPENWKVHGTNCSKQKTKSWN